MKSILQKEKKCYFCGQTYDLEYHHIFFGISSNKKLCEKYGLMAWLCVYHHRGSFAGVHFCKSNNLFLKREAQMRFEKNFPTLDFKAIFGKNYL